MLRDQWILTLSTAAIGISILGAAWLVWVWTAPATVQDGGEAGSIEVLVAEPVQPELPPLEPLRTAAEEAEVADTTEWIAGMASDMTVQDNLGDPLELEVVHRLDRLQGEECAGFAERIDAALARFETPPVEPHEETTDEFLHRAELSAWSSALTSSFKTISLSSDTQEIAPEQLRAAIGGGR